jgi:hypothetical protein
MLDRVSTKVLPPPPPNYRANFEKGGWRLCERLYGARTDLHLKWQAVTGCVNPRAKNRTDTIVSKVQPS